MKAMPERYNIEDEIKKYEIKNSEMKIIIECKSRKKAKKLLKKILK